MRHKKEKNKFSVKFIRIIIPILFVVGGLNVIPSCYANPEPGSMEIFGLKKKKKKKDPFAKKIDKKKNKPNIYCTNPPRTKSRSKLYTHSMSRKKVKSKTNQSVFSATKPRYNIAGTKSGKSSRKENKGRRSEK